MRMSSLVNCAKVFKWTTHPELLDQTLEYGPSFEERFRRRGRELAGVLSGEPCQDLGLLERPRWNAQLQRVACWKYPNYFVCLLLERPQHHDRCSIRFWSVTTADMESLLRAAETRAERIADRSGFAVHLDRLLVLLGQAGTEKFWQEMLATDDLAALPTDEAWALLRAALRHPEPDRRCSACTLLMTVFGDAAIPDIVAACDDPEEYIRHHAVHLLARGGADAAVEPLMRMLRGHSCVEVRAGAAYALGHIDSPEAIPALMEAIDSDDESTALGHSPRSIAATALDNLLGTNETRIATDDGVCKMAPWEPDHELLKRRAREVYAEWRVGRS